MEVFDKITWQTDGGISENDAISHFEFIFKWLMSMEMLSQQGKEILEYGLDGTESLSENDVTKDGASFLSEYYDYYISKTKYGTDEDIDLLNSLYQKWKGTL